MAGGITLGMKALGIGGDDAAEQVARLLREGRAAEVTDEMLGALGPNDQAKLFDLYESGATGMDLPMDEASRMGRAARGGFDTPAVHFSRHGVDVSSLDSGKVAMSPFDAVGTHLGTPDAALDRFRNTTATTDVQAAGTTYPVTARAVRQLLDGGQPWDEETLSQALRARGGYNEPGADYRALNDRLRRDIFSDHDAIAYRNDVEAPGSTSYVVPPANIRSRHARFDPRLSKNADLLASRAAPGSGGIGTQEPSSAPRGIMAIPMRPTSPTMPSGDWPSLSDVLGRLKQAFGLAGKAGLEGYAQALTGQDEQGRSVGNILPFAKDERTGDVGLASPRILDLWNTAGGSVPARGVTLGAGPVVRRAAEGLPMDQASRMARAKEMGFDVDTALYHGSADDFDSFDLDINRTGAGFEAAWLTDDASLAYRYSRSAGAGPKDAKVMEVRAALNNPRIIDVEEVIRQEADKIGADLDMFDSMEEAQNILLGPDWKKNAAADARADGHDGLVLENFIDMPGGGYAESPATVYAVFDPAKIRKLEAAFDPAKRDSADLLASRAAPGSLGIGGNDRRLTFRDIEDQA